MSAIDDFVYWYQELPTWAQVGIPIGGAGIVGYMIIRGRTTRTSNGEIITGPVSGGPVGGGGSVGGGGGGGVGDGSTPPSTPGPTMDWSIFQPPTWYGQAPAWTVNPPDWYSTPPPSTPTFPSGPPDWQDNIRHWPIAPPLPDAQTSPNTPASRPGPTDYTKANETLRKDIAVYAAIPKPQRTAKQQAALNTDIATLGRQTGTSDRSQPGPTDYTKANEKLLRNIKIYLAIPINKRTFKQQQALETDIATYVRQGGKITW